MRAMSLLLAAAIWCGVANAQVPRILNYQGYLTNSGGTPINTTASMVFKLYTVSTGGTASYTETQSVIVSNGIFDVIIGAVTPLNLPFDVPYYLGVTVGLDVEMSPRRPVSASAYTLRALAAETVNGTSGLRLEPNGQSPNHVAGWAGNSVTAGSVGASIGGGGSNGFANQVTSTWGTVGGGQSNIASTYGTVGGGSGNTANFKATVSGGVDNHANGDYSTVSGGATNTAGGNYSTVSGGSLNVANGSDSFAAGRNAKANRPGMFVWADSLGTDFDMTQWRGALSQSDNTFNVRATGIGGVFFATAINGLTGQPTWACYTYNGAGWTCTSDRNVKRNLRPIDQRDALAKVVHLPVYRWQPRTGPNSELDHIGPMAQDFYGAFGLGDSDKSIGLLDATGVALAAIQGLNAKLEEQTTAFQMRMDEKDAKIEAQLARIDALEQRASEIAMLQQQMAELQAAAGLAAAKLAAVR